MCEGEEAGERWDTMLQILHTHKHQPETTENTGSISMDTVIYLKEIKTLLMSPYDFKFSLKMMYGLWFF